MAFERIYSWGGTTLCWLMIIGIRYTTQYIGDHNPWARTGNPVTTSHHFGGVSIGWSDTVEIQNWDIPRGWCPLAQLIIIDDWSMTHPCWHTSFPINPIQASCVMVKSQGFWFNPNVHQPHQIHQTIPYIPYTSKPWLRNLNNDI